MIGQKIRTARKEKGLTMLEVAGQAQMSVATLSRIETGKQAVDLSVFLLISRILERNPADFLAGDSAEENLADPLIRKIAALAFEERMKLWKQLASDARLHRRGERRIPTRQLAIQIEELLAQIDFLRAEIEAASRRLRPV